MYGLKQAAMLARKKFHSLLSEQGYCSIISSMGLWNHPERKILLNLCVDNFGIKYFNKDDVQHLINKLSKTYKVNVDWSGKTSWDIPSIDTTTKVMLTLTYQDSSIKPSKNSITHILISHNTLLTNVFLLLSPKKEKDNMLLIKILHLSLIQKTQNGFKWLLVVFSGFLVLWTLRC